MKEEVEMLKEESLFQAEELSKYQRHSASLADEVTYPILLIDLAVILQSSKQRFAKETGRLRAHAAVVEWEWKQLKRNNYLRGLKVNI